jgi:two-component system sensor histidine kinase GlrK
MSAMRLARPRSLSGLLLIGFSLVAVPLFVAVVNAAVQIRALADESKTLVRQGVDITRHNQLLFEEIAALERTARLYQVLGRPDLLDVFRDNHRRFLGTIGDLQALTQPDSMRKTLEAIGAAGISLDSTLRAAGQDSAALSRVVGGFTQLADSARAYAQGTNQLIETQLNKLQDATERAQRTLFWQSAMLLPITIFIVAFVTLRLARPLRQIDRAIGELGRGTFSRAIAVQGPSDLEALGRQLEWLRLRLLELAQEKNRFLRHMSHELKTPLANIREGTELLMDGAVGELETGQREVTAILRDNGLKLQRLIENLLSYSAWQAQSTGLELSEFRLRPLVKNAIEAQQLTLIGQRVRLDVQIHDLTVIADRAKVRLILDNLLSNAIKFTPRGGSIHIHARNDRGQLLLDVADSGPGIAAEDRSRIFEAFYQGRTPQGGHVKGTGIGLSVVLEFAHAHGGTVEILDGEFPGAHFRLRLPMRQRAGEPKERAHAA